MEKVNLKSYHFNIFGSCVKRGTTKFFTVDVFADQSVNFLWSCGIELLKTTFEQWGGAKKKLVCCRDIYIYIYIYIYINVIVIFWPLFPIRSRSVHAPENMISIFMKTTKCDLDRNLSITRSLTLMHCKHVICAGY